MKRGGKGEVGRKGGKLPRLPFVFVNVAMSADGKLAPVSREFVAFTSERDQGLMLELRARADGVMSGARTVDAGEVSLGAGGERFRKLRRRRGLAEENVRVIVSGSGTIDPKAFIFAQRFSPILILTTERAGKRLATLRKLADGVHVSAGKELDFGAALEWLRKEWGVKRLLCEGGGEVNAGLFEAGLVDEVYLTVAPLIIGGRGAPTLADGAGIGKLAEARQFKFKKFERVGDELYLVLGKK